MEIAKLLRFYGEMRPKFFKTSGLDFLRMKSMKKKKNRGKHYRLKSIMYTYIFI